MLPIGSVYFPCILPIGSVYFPCILPIGSVYFSCMLPIGSVYFPCILPIGEPWKIVLSFPPHVVKIFVFQDDQEEEPWAFSEMSCHKRGIGFAVPPGLLSFMRLRRTAGRGPSGSPVSLILCDCRYSPITAEPALTASPPRRSPSIC